MTKYELEDRLINFAANTILFTETYKKNFAGIHLSSQIIRSPTSPALNYGEAQSAESPKDFVHKMGICLKELRETLVNLKLAEKAHIISDSHTFKNLQKEANELISIFVVSIKTSKSNSQLLAIATNR